MFKRLRIAILLYILLFVALGQFLAARRSTDWNDGLWVHVHPVNGSGTESVQAYIDALEPDAFAAVERFFTAQSERYGVALEQPFYIRLADQLDAPPPATPEDAGFISTAIWSLRMRWFATRLQWADDGPTPDITLFAIYADGAEGGALDRSTALRKGLIAIANLFASRQARGSNGMIVAHELLHTLGATDKYDPATTLPVYPAGYADPGRKPRHPQSQAELMAGRIPVGPNAASVPRSLDQVTIGPQTALEIGWPAGP